MVGVGYGQGRSVSDVRQAPNWTDEQQELFNQIASYIGKGFENYTPFEGDFYTPTTTEQQGYLDWVKNSQAQREAALTQILSGKLTPEQEKLYNDPNAIADYYSTAVRAPAVREYENITAPAVKEAYAGPGYWGTSRANAQATSAENLATNLAAARSELEYKNRQDYGEALSGALNRQAAYGPTALNTEAGIKGSAASMSAAEEDEKMMGEYQSWLNEQGFNNPFLQLVFQLMGLSPYSYTPYSTSRDTNTQFGVTYTSS